MQITIIAVGKMKERYLLEGIKEFSKRLTKYTKLDIIEVPYVPAPEALFPKDLEKIKIQEGKKILSNIKSGYVIALVVERKQLSSVELAKKIERGVTDIGELRQSGKIKEKLMLLKIKAVGIVSFKNRLIIVKHNLFFSEEENGF